ncbi:MAG: hypothetical protein KDA57_01630 [Planctomycetales bacterium]|nr:hypothetical protein [Planctomycetales bacterium]
MAEEEKSLGESAENSAALWEAADSPSVSGPDVFLLPDEQGTLRKVLGFRYEDFLKAWQQRNQMAAGRPPTHLLERIEVTGDTTDTHANLQINVEILPQVGGWIKVPLDLPAFLVQEWDLSEKTENECLVFDVESDSHLLWMNCKPDVVRKLRLQGLSKLNLTPTDLSLELKLPHAAKSEFVLQVPSENAQFEVSPGVDIETIAIDEPGTKVRIFGQARPLRLHWNTSERKESTGDTVVEVLDQLAVQIDRQRSYYEAELKINSYGKPLERLQVRLPIGAKLTERQQTEEFRIVEKSLDAELGDIVEIELSQPHSDPWVLRLSAEQPLSTGQVDPDSAEADAEYRLTGFKVLNAFRQSGTLALHVEEHLQAYFDLEGDIEQTPKHPISWALPSSTPLASFNYSRAPWALVVHTLGRQQRVSVTPDYKIQLRQGEADLRVGLDYQFAGAQTFTVRIDMRGWELTDAPIESNGLIDPDKVFEKPGGLLVLSLVDPNVQQLRLGLSLRRSVELGHRTIPLPAVQEAFVLPGQLSVAVDPSIQVTPTIVATEGVSVVTDSEVMSNSNGNDDASDTIYLRTFLPRAALSAELKLRDRQVATNMSTLVEVSQQSLQVRQQLNYEVKYRPTQLLLLQLPESLWDNETLEAQLDGEPLQFHIDSLNGSPAADERIAPPAAPDAKVRQLRIPLPRPREDRFQLEFSYAVPCPDLAAKSISPLVLPLISPDDLVRTNQVVIHTSKPIRASLNQTAGEGPWSANTETEPASSDKTSMQIKGGGRATSLPLLLQVDSLEDVEFPTLESAWLQTWMVGDQQQIRSAFRFRTSQQTVYVQLPTNLQKEYVEVLMDGSLAEFELQANRRIAIAVDGHEERTWHTIEIRYQQPARISSWSPLRLRLPRLECRSTSAHVYWQLVLPRGWHTVRSPSQLIAEAHIGWNQFRWGRQPTLFQQDLESLTRATAAPPPPESTNQYLYHGLALPHEIDVWVVSYLWLVILSSLAMFCLGLLWLYTSVAKQVPFWLVVGLLLASIVVSYPELSLLAVQAIFWGGLMTFAAVSLRRSLSDRLRPDLLSTPISRPASTAVTESWIHGQGDLPFDEESETTSIQAGGPV